MIGDAEQFILDVRKAVRLEQKPIATTNAQLFDPATAQSAIARATAWLNPQVVAAYEPETFADRPPQLRQDLYDAVNDFRTSTRVALGESPDNGQWFREGMRAFTRLASAVRSVVLEEWQESADRVLGRIEEWAAKSDWVVRRTPKQLDETLLGHYSLGKLELYAEGNRYLLDPIARFVHGGLGAFDFSILPTSYVATIYRHTDGLWYVRTDVGQGVDGPGAAPLTRESFGLALTELLALV